MDGRTDIETGFIRSSRSDDLKILQRTKSRTAKPQELLVNSTKKHSKLLEQMSLQRTKAGLEMELNRAIRAYKRDARGDQEQLRDDIEKT